LWDFDLSLPFLSACNLDDNNDDEYMTEFFLIHASVKGEKERKRKKEVITGSLHIISCVGFFSFFLPLTPDFSYI